MARLLFKKSTEELEQLFRECADSPEQLIILAAELVHRQRPKAIALRKEVEAALAKRGKTNVLPALSGSTENSLQSQLPQMPNHSASPARQAAAQAYVDSVIQGQPNTKIFGNDLAKTIANEEKQKDIQKRNERHIPNKTFTPNPEKNSEGVKADARSKNTSWAM